LDTKFFHRPFATYGYNAQFNGGIEYDPGKFSFSVAAYDVAPWGNQTVISRVFRCRLGEVQAPAAPQKIARASPLPTCPQALQI